MDYKYIEQLLERYWECETTLQEETILHTFFSQQNVPAHLEKYRDVFAVNDSLMNESLGEDFDERIMSLIREREAQPHVVVKARRISIFKRVQPLYKAAAMVAIILTIGMAAQHSFVDDSLAPSENTSRMAEDPDAEFTILPQGMENTSAEATQTWATPDTLETIK